MSVTRVAPSVRVLTLALALLSAVDPADGHGYLASPRSRNLVAHEDGAWWPLDPNNPRQESQPQSANIGGTDAVCGIIEDRNYDHPQNAVGEPMPVNVQACWRPGQEVDLSVVLTAHHKGHFEFKVCPIQPGEVATQDCFDQHPLEFVQETLPPGCFRATAPKDTNYPGRAYVPPASEGWEMSYRYLLPTGLAGDLVLLQWYYATANTCHVEGYEYYPFPDGWNPGTQPCPHGSIPPDGRGFPEQFWNCAEVTISTSCPVPTPTPVTTTVAATTTTSSIRGSRPVTPIPADPGPSPAPPTNCPVPPTETQCNSTVTCESIGFPGYCCSEFGWCGTSDIHCGEYCLSGPCLNGTTTTTTTTVPDTTSTTTTTVAITQAPVATPPPPPPPTNCPVPPSGAQCSASITCTSIGFPGYCCSQWGWCGTSSAHCGECCQSGPCLNGPTPPPPTTTTATTVPDTTTTTTTTTTTVAITQAPVATPPPPPPPTNCPIPPSGAQCSASITCTSIGFPDYCCSQWGWCGTSAAHCDECCQSGPCLNGPTPPPPTTTTATTVPDTTTTTTTTTTVAITQAPMATPPPPPTPTNCPVPTGTQCSTTVTCMSIGFPDDHCCSQWGWCGTSKEHCGECCQSGPCLNELNTYLFHY